MSIESNDYIVPTTTSTVPTHTVMQYGAVTIDASPCPVLAQLTDADMQRVRTIVAEEVAKALKEAKGRD